MLKIFTSIYDDIFCKTFSQSFYIFLCGGAAQEHIRNKVRNQLEISGLQVLYPEDLFMDMLNRNKKADLLEYENLLADNSDAVCIICESMGSAVELGAFVQNETLQQKLVVCINKKYARDKSFVMMGPVKHLQKKDKSAVIFYKDREPIKLADDLIARFHRAQKLSVKGNKMQSFNNLSAHIAFIPMISYFYKSINRKDLHKTLKELLTRQKTLPSKYNELFNASIKYLIKSGRIVSKYDSSEMDDVLSLSKKGYLEVNSLLQLSWGVEKTMLRDKIRCAILKEQLNS